MKFILLSDVHLTNENPMARLDNLVNVQFDKLSFVFNLAKKEEAVILQAGDLFDKPRSWALLPLVTEFIRKYNVPIFCVMGQHDTYMYSEETRDRTNIGILAKAGLVTLLSPETPVSIGNVNIYGANFGQNLPHFSPIKKTILIGVIHASISDREIYSEQQFLESEKFLNDYPEYSLILCGDVHRAFYHQKKDRHILNVGPMTRHEATEYNFSHRPGLAIFNSEDGSLCWVDIPHENAITVLSREHIERKKEAEELLREFTGQLTVNNNSSRGNDVSFLSTLWEFIRDNNIEKEVVDLLTKMIEEGVNDER